MNQNRFPKPDFESGYQYPEIFYRIPAEGFWQVVDIVLLVLLTGVVAWAVYRRRTRRPVVWVSLISVAYFGFFRDGCVCSIGSVQNVALALTDSSYVLPLPVLLIFILPLVVAFLAGRLFCAGVCPFGALQDLVNVRQWRPSRAVSAALEMIPWIYLIFALLYAVTRTSFLICRFDPFIGIFRLGGDLGLMLFGGLLLVTSVFTGRPFCRFLCPYGALLGLFSRVSLFKITLTEKKCIRCDLCHNACPVDAIRPPYDNKVGEPRKQGVKRVLHYAVILPLLVVAGALLMRSLYQPLSRSHKEVRLYEEVVRYEADPAGRLTVELEAFYGQGGTPEALAVRVAQVQALFLRYATWAGALLGALFGFTLIRLSVKRARPAYEIDPAHCVACGRCFSYCPQNGTQPKTPIP